MTKAQQRPPLRYCGAAAVNREEYKVGPGRPPREHQFKPGQSGNPKGAKRKPPSLLPDLKQLLEHALSEKVTLKQGEKAADVTMAQRASNSWSPSSPKAIVMPAATSSALADKLGVDL